MPDCQSIDPLITPYVDGDIGAGQRQIVDEHLRACPPCHSRVPALAADRVRCLAVITPFVGPTAGGAALEPAMASTFGWGMNMPEEGGAGLELVGARPFLYAGGKMAHLMYRHNGHPMSVFM